MIQGHLTLLFLENNLSSGYKTLVTNVLLISFEFNLFQMPLQIVFI